MSALTDFCAPFFIFISFFNKQIFMSGCCPVVHPHISKHHISRLMMVLHRHSLTFHILSIISSKFCFVRLFGLNLMTKQLWCFSDRWNHHISHFLCKSWKKASVKLSPILLNQHIASFSNFLSWPLNKTWKLREPCDMCLDHGRGASLGNLLVTQLFLQGANETLSAACTCFCSRKPPEYDLLVPCPHS